MTGGERDGVLARITATDDLADLVECDLVIESIVEELTAKRLMFAELERVVKSSAILATNTSTLPVVELAMATQRPDQVCGIHFFNPVTRMRLVEVVRPITASDDTVKAALAFATTCGKEAIEVVDRAGFVVNALLFPFLNSAVRMFEQGTAAMEDIDTAMCAGCNFPMGPFALLDLVGLDTPSPSSMPSTRSSTMRSTPRHRRCDARWRPASSDASRASASTDIDEPRCGPDEGRHAERTCSSRLERPGGTADNAVAAAVATGRRS